MFCKACGKQLSDNAKFCDNCGAPVAGKATVQHKQGPSAVLIILLVIVLIAAACGVGYIAAQSISASQDPGSLTPWPSWPNSTNASDPTPAHSTAPTVHPYTAISSPILAESSQRYLTADDLEPLSANELVLARSEIFARHGVIFTDADLSAYFESQSWYQGTVAENAFDQAALSDQEAVNIQLIDLYLKIADGYYTPAANNPYIAYYDPTAELLLPKSSNTRLTTADLIGFNADQLLLIRNQIIALHGYAFDDQELMAYFLQCAWYRPSTPPGRTDLVKGMTGLEYDNMSFIFQYEQNPISGNNTASAHGIVPGSITGSWMLVGEQNPIGYRVTTWTFSADAAYTGFADVYEHTGRGWHASGLADQQSRGNYTYQGGALSMYNIESAIPPNESASGEWEWVPSGPSDTWQITVSEDGNTLYFWKNNQVASAWLRVNGSTTDMLNALYPNG